MKNNFFPTLSEALEAENLSHAWDGTPLAYGQTIGKTFDDGSRFGYYVSIYRYDYSFKISRTGIRVTIIVRLRIQVKEPKHAIKQ